ncbi:MAG: tetrahydromethanopterin S-methyltransferase subunit G [Candidatus Nezhaarchaeales archaeon]
MSLDEEEFRVPTVIAPPEIVQLHSKLNAINEKVNFTLSEVAHKEGLRMGSYIGFLYGFLTGSMIMLVLKFVLRIL